MEIKGIAPKDLITLLVGVSFCAWVFGLVKLAIMATGVDGNGGIWIGFTLLFFVGAFVLGVYQHLTVEDRTDAEGKKVARMFAFWPVFTEDSMIWLRMYYCWYDRGYVNSTKSKEEVELRERLKNLQREKDEVDGRETRQS